MPVRREHFALLVAAGALAFGLVAVTRTHGALALAWAVVFGATTGLVVAIDLRERRIPNLVTYNGTLIAIVVAALLGGIPAALSALGGAFAAGAVTTGLVVLGRGGLGLGDAKFSAFAGAFLGLGGVPAYLAISLIAGAVIALGLLATGRGRRSTFAFGPALAVGVLSALFLKGAVLT
ncbi:MAG: prepilin peptidase [Dehalococcoidia bacterium]